MFYDFVNQFVGYRLDEYDGSKIRIAEKYINNEGEDFNIIYRQGEFLKNGNSHQMVMFGVQSSALASRPSIFPLHSTRVNPAFTSA
jgi:hypothetical protein